MSAAADDWELFEADFRSTPSTITDPPPVDDKPAPVAAPVVDHSLPAAPAKVTRRDVLPSWAHSKKDAAGCPLSGRRVPDHPQPRRVGVRP